MNTAATTTAADIRGASFTDNGAVYLVCRTFTTVAILEYGMDEDGCVKENDLTLVGCYVRGEFMRHLSGALMLNVSGRYFSADAYSMASAI